jgi:hypothetical protein
MHTKWQFTLRKVIFLKNLDSMTIDAKMSHYWKYNLRSIIRHFLARPNVSLWRGEWYHYDPKWCVSTLGWAIRETTLTWLLSYQDTYIWKVRALMQLQEHIRKRHVFIKHCTMCSKHDNHYELGNQHTLGDLYDHLMSGSKWDNRSHSRHRWKCL